MGDRSRGRTGRREAHHARHLSELDPCACPRPVRLRISRKQARASGGDTNSSAVGLQQADLAMAEPPSARSAQAAVEGSSTIAAQLPALRTWRYFAEFSTEEHHWLIPDNVQEDGTKVAPRISPTNLGFLFNVRQVACDFGYLTVPEFAQLNLLTLATASQMQRYQGHFLNWYDTRSLAPLTPSIVSSVDNGNLVASLWTLQQGCLQLLDQPLLQKELAEGIIDHLYLLTTLGALSRRKFSRIERVAPGAGLAAVFIEFLPTQFSPTFVLESQT